MNFFLWFRKDQPQKFQLETKNLSQHICEHFFLLENNVYMVTRCGKIDKIEPRKPVSQ